MEYETLHQMHPYQALLPGWAPAQHSTKEITMTIYNPKTDDELLGDIRTTARAIRDANDSLPALDLIEVHQIQRLESLGNALAIYCKLLADRLDVGPNAAVEHLRASLEGE